MPLGDIVLQVIFPIIINLCTP